MVEPSVRVSLFLTLFGLSLTSCTLAPSYTRPDAPVSETFPAAPEAEEGVTAADLGWREVFEDARLQALVELALENNRDLLVAALNVERFQALYRIERSFLFPQVGANASATFQELPPAIPSSAFAPKEQYSANVAVSSWELDFFGRIRSLSEAALQRYFATREAQRNVHLSLVSQVAIAHFQERALEEQLVLARNTMDLVEESYRITHRAFEAGIASELDLRTAESQVETTRFNLALYEQLHAQAVNGLVFLVGTPLPGDLPEPLPLAEAVVETDLPPGLPSDLLVRRPDILAAEHELLAANASIGAARAAFFPSVNLTGAAGYASTDLGQLFSGDSFTWNFTPRINLPIFQGGRLKANLDASEITTSIEIARYQRTIQVAFREVADALVAKEAIEERLRAQAARVAANERRYFLADRRYRAGIDSYVTLLTAQQELYSSQQLLINAHTDRLANVASLYRALGGGWLETPADTGADAG
jgi:multidrug efflux system outer membrane protein